MTPDPLKRAVAKAVMEGAATEIIKRERDGRLVRVHTQVVSDIEMLIKVDATSEGGPRWFKVKVSEML